MNTDKLFSFINSSPTAYHAVAEVKKALLNEGFSELSSASPIPEGGGSFFITRNDSSIVAFKIPENPTGFMIVASHSDSPAFRLKGSCEKVGAYSRLDVEKYGGMIYSTWLDRPLSLAGRVIIRTEDGIKSVLVNLDENAFVIPSVAIHLNRSVNDGYKYNPAVDMLPLSGVGGEKGIMKLVSDKLGVCEESVISHDLFVYNRDEARLVGKENGLILSPRLDDLECVYFSLEAFLAAKPARAVSVLAVFDNEEVGSETKQGAASTLLYDALAKIAGARYGEMLENSLMVSADNAHALHPAHPELSDAQNAPMLNGGIVIKFNANQRYATDGVSEALFRVICERAGARVQTYSNRADMPGGSTLGSISNTKVSIPTVDIGLPQLAMHSACETAGACDGEDMLLALTELYSSSLVKNGSEIKVVK